MKLGDWKNAARLPLPKAVEASPSDFQRFGVIEPDEPSAKIVRFELKELVKFTRLTVEATAEASAAMSVLGHPGNLMIEKDKNTLDESLNFMFYGQSGEGDRVKQAFEARFVGEMIEVIITPFRSSEVYGLMYESDSTITSRRLYEACLKDLRMLRGWPPETEFEPKRWLEKGVEGRAVFAGDIARPPIASGPERRIRLRARRH